MFAQRSFFENLVGIVVGGLLLLSNIALGHHSISPFDRESIQELEGTVSSVQWINPHIRLTIRVGDEEWEVEGDSPNAAERQGLTRESMQVGDEVRLAGWPSTLGRREVFLTNILIDGAETVVMDLNLPLVFTQSEEAPFVDPAEADPDRGIFRVWSCCGALCCSRHAQRHSQSLPHRNY